MGKRPHSHCPFCNSSSSEPWLTELLLGSKCCPQHLPFAPNHTSLEVRSRFQTQVLGCFRSRSNVCTAKRYLSKRDGWWVVLKCSPSSMGVGAVPSQQHSSEGTPCSKRTRPCAGPAQEAAQSHALKHKSILLNTTPLSLWGVPVENINSKEHWWMNE